MKHLNVTPGARILKMHKSFIATLSSKYTIEYGDTLVEEKRVELCPFGALSSPGGTQHGAEEIGSGKMRNRAVSEERKTRRIRLKLPFENRPKIDLQNIKHICAFSYVLLLSRMIYV